MAALGFTATVDGAGDAGGGGGGWVVGGGGGGREGAAGGVRRGGGVGAGSPRPYARGGKAIRRHWRGGRGGRQPGRALRQTPVSPGGVHHRRTERLGPHHAGLQRQRVV